jgi:hypothetical protein
MNPATAAIPTSILAPLLEALKRLRETGRPPEDFAKLLEALREAGVSGQVYRLLSGPAANANVVETAWCLWCAPGTVLAFQVDPSLLPLVQLPKTPLRNVPRWDPEERTLRLGGRLLLEFRRRSAPFREALLNAFQEAGWPRMIPAPAVFRCKYGDSERLKDTVRKLNGKLFTPLIRFRRDGTGEGVRWERLAAKPARKRKTNRGETAALGTPVGR